RDLLSQLIRHCIYFQKDLEADLTQALLVAWSDAQTMVQRDNIEAALQIYSKRNHQVMPPRVGYYQIIQSSTEAERDFDGLKKKYLSLKDEDDEERTILLIRLMDALEACPTLFDTIRNGFE